MKKKLPFFLIAFFALLLDQVSKYFVLLNIPSADIDPFAKVEFIPNILSFVHNTNTGAVFGYFENNAFLLGIISVLITVFIIYLAMKLKEDEKLQLFSFALILGGALGNIYDRFFRDGVIDFINTEFINWPAFNLADTWLCIGVAIIIIDCIFFAKKRCKNTTTDSTECSSNT